MKKDQQVADLLHQITKRFVAWGFWMVYHYIRRQGYDWNHKRVYRIWKAEDGGELVLYRGEEDSQGMRVSPSWGTIVVFLSEEFPHEVLPANRDRYSIAGWYHLNSSTLPRVHSLG